MKPKTMAVAAVVLIATGAIADRTLNLSVNGPSAASAKAPAPSIAPATSTLSFDQATQHAYALASPSVVYVSNVGVGSGSGVIYDTNGDIVTNAHVVSGGQNFSVTLNDGRTFPATVVGTDPADDIAVIRINASGLTPARFGRAGTFHMAQTVLAIGSPLGLKQSVTSGLISGLGRVAQEPGGGYLPDAIQTSAPINPGNSGGALVTLSGVVVGIPTLEQTSSSNGAAAQNIGFAVPSNRVVALANQIVASGKVQHTGRAYLGIAPTDSSAGQSGSSFFQGGFGPDQSTPNVAGALVSQLSSGGPASKAGVQQGDVITNAGGTSIANAEDLLTVIAQKKPGDTITLKLNRAGSNVSVQVHLGEMPG